MDRIDRNPKDSYIYSIKQWIQIRPRRGRILFV